MRINTKQGLAPIIAIIIALLVIGGGGYAIKKASDKGREKKEKDKQEEMQKNEDTEKDSDGAVRKEAKAAQKTLQVKLTEQSTSGQGGQAVIVQIGTSTVRVIVNLTGKPSGVPQPAHIHLGACPTPGAIKYPLMDVGNGASQTDIPNLTIEQLLTQLPLAVNVHKSATDIKTYVACGDIKTADTLKAEAEATPTVATPKVTTVGYSASGFSPRSIGIKKGDTVLWKGDGTPMWVASDEHPSHMEYDGTSRQQHCAAGATPSFDQCRKADVYSFIFNKIGAFNYHNHAHAGDEGVVMVTQ